jgi:hypothetical protein
LIDNEVGKQVDSGLCSQGLDMSYLGSLIGKKGVPKDLGFIKKNLSKGYTSLILASKTHWGLR